jgi:hypothetical protein
LGSVCRQWALCWLVALPFAAAAQSPAPPESERVIDRAVALIEGEVLTLSDLEFETRVALIQAGGIEAAHAPLDDSVLADSLETAIGFRLEANEADKLQAYPLEEGEVDAALRAFRDRFDSPKAFDEFLARHEADLQLLGTVLTRSLRAAKIIDGKLRLKAHVNDAEVKRYFQDHADELKGRSYEELRAPIRQHLMKQKFEQLTRDELLQIRRGANVRVLAPFARRQSAAPGTPSGSSVLR